MLKKYRFEVYSKKMDHTVILSKIADNKSQAIKLIQDSMYELDISKPKVKDFNMDGLDKVKPRVKDFKLLSINKNLIDPDKKYQTTEGNPVTLYIYNSKTKNYNATIYKDKENRGSFGNVKKENCLYDRFGEYYDRYEHKNNLIEVK